MNEERVGVGALLTACLPSKLKNEFSVSLRLFTLEETRACATHAHSLAWRIAKAEMSGGRFYVGTGTYTNIRCANFGHHTETDSKSQRSRAIERVGHYRTPTIGGNFEKKLIVACTNNRY